MASTKCYEGSPGELVTTTGGAKAFLPDPLPPSVQYDDKLVNDLNQAMLAVG